MKFLVLALCVCAASAASFGSFGRYSPYNKAASAVASAPVVAAQAVASAGAPFVAPVAKAAAQVYQNAPEVAKAAAQVYQQAPQVVSKSVSYNKEAEAAIVRSDSEVNAEGYNYAYETSNGISGESSGTLKQVGDAAVLAVQGAYRYVSPDGTPVYFTYIADENGYQPQSDLLPVAPPVPEAILRSIAYIKAHPQAPETYKNY